jgi:addiction module RelB/DinJ family antitoxin
MSNTTTVIQTRIPLIDKEMAEKICEYYGLSLNEAIRLMVKSIVNTNSIPVNLSLKSNERLPDASELEAIKNFIANPDTMSVEETKELEKELGIRLNFTH